ncbi:MAG: restriction endonuclease [Halapricum sp.]
MGTVITLYVRGQEGLREAADERLDGQYLSGEALSTYVGEDEQVAYVLVNKRSGVTVERAEGEETYKPARKRRALVAVTDVRLLVAVGGADGGADRIVSIPLSTIMDVDTQQSFLGGALVVTTDADEAWTIPCRDDLDDVVSYLNSAQRAWSRADRFTAKADERIETARDRLDEAAYDQALDLAGDALSILADGRDILDTFEMGEGVLANAEFEGREASIRTIQRRAHAGIAAAHRARAHDHRSAERFEDAHDRLERAREACEQALAIAADDPPGDELAARLDAIERETNALERAPAMAAEATLATARDVEDPEQRSESLEDALDRYRDLLGVCWGPDASFRGDTDAIRERILVIVEEALDARIAVARQSLVAADRLAVRDQADSALAACDRADEQLDAARTVVDELAPAKSDAIETWRAAVEDQRDRIEGRHDDDTSEECPARSTDDPQATEGDPQATDADPTVERADGQQEPASRDDRLAALDRPAFTRLVADLWRSVGWQTTVFTESVDQYDVMASRTDPVELRVLVWAVHRPGGALGTTAIDRCAADRANVEQADVAALVTTGDVPDTVRDRARDHNVKLLDREDLLDNEDVSAILEE